MRVKVQAVLTYGGDAKIIVRRWWGRKCALVFDGDEFREMLADAGVRAEELLGAKAEVNRERSGFRLLKTSGWAW